MKQVEYKGKYLYYICPNCNHYIKEKDGCDIHYKNKRKANGNTASCVKYDDSNSRPEHCEMGMY